MGHDAMMQLDGTVKKNDSCMGIWQQHQAVTKIAGRHFSKTNCSDLGQRNSHFVHTVTENHCLSLYSSSVETFFVIFSRLTGWPLQSATLCSFKLGRKDPGAWGKSWNLSSQRYSRRPTQFWRNSLVPFHVASGFHWSTLHWQSGSRSNFPRWNPPLPWRRGASRQRRTRNVSGKQQP